MCLARLKIPVLPNTFVVTFTEADGTMNLQNRVAAIFVAAVASGRLELRNRRIPKWWRTITKTENSYFFSRSLVNHCTLLKVTWKTKDTILRREQSLLRSSYFLGRSTETMPTRMKQPLPPSVKHDGLQRLVVSIPRLLFTASLRQEILVFRRRFTDRCQVIPNFTLWIDYEEIAANISFRPESMYLQRRFMF